MKTPADKNDTRPQAERFKDAAKSIGCDESEAAFDLALKKIATAKVERPKPKKPAKK